MTTKPEAHHVAPTEVVRPRKMNLTARHRRARVDQTQKHKDQRDALRIAHRRATTDVLLARHQNRPTGLAAFMGRVSGVALVRRVWHRHEDAKRVKVYAEQRRELKGREEQERKVLAQRMYVQSREVERRHGALDKIEKRELAAFMRDQRAEQRARDRDGDGRMPSIAEKQADPTQRPQQAPDLIAAFTQAKQPFHTEVPDLMASFERAARDRAIEGDGGGSSPPGNLDNNPPPPSGNSAPDRDPDKSR